MYSVKEMAMKETKFLIPMNLQHFSDGDDDGGGAGDENVIDDMAGLDSLLDEMENQNKQDDNQGGGDSDDSNDDDDNSDDDTGNGDGDADDDGDDDSDDDQQKDDDQADKEKQKKSTKKDTTKDNHAFAAMRKENSDLKKQLSSLTAVVNNLAKGLGMDPNADDVLDQLNDAGYRGQAKRSGRTAAQVKEDSQKDQLIAQYQANEIKQHNYAGFNKLRADYGLTDNEIIEFAKDLAAQGMDIQKQRVDVEGIYFRANKEKIIEAATAKAVEQALKRSNEADQNSGGAKKNGKRTSNKKELNTEADLDNWLKANKL